jgi:hypothetical protein
MRGYRDDPGDVRRRRNGSVVNPSADSRGEHDAGISVPTESPRRLWVIACLATIAAGVLLVTPLLLMGPSAPDDDSYVDGPVIATGGGRQSWPLAGVTGQLTMERGCLLLAGSPVYWPNGTSWDATTREVVFSDGTRLGVGSILSGGGGAHSTTDLDAQPKTTAVAATLGCIRRTDSPGATFAYPSLSLHGG